MADHDYSDFRDAPADNLMARIAATATLQQKAQNEVDRLEEELRDAKDKLKDISEHQLPELMDEADMQDFTTRDGVRISVDEVIRGNIPKKYEPQAHNWLEQNGHGDLLKREFKIEFNRDEEEWAKAFEKRLREENSALRFKATRSVHTQTLRSFVREALANGEDIPMDVFGVYRQRVSKLKS